jgi:hypothetical protein
MTSCDVDKESADTITPRRADASVPIVHDPEATPGALASPVAVQGVCLALMWTGSTRSP